MTTRHRPIYRGDGWVLAICDGCRRTNYVDPHSTSGECQCAKRERGSTNHRSIPEELRVNGLMGLYVAVDSSNRLVQ